MNELGMNYGVFVLGYDLLHNVLAGLECDVAYEFCVKLYNDYYESKYNDFWFSEYMCLSKYVDDHMDEIKAKLEELR